MSQKLMGRYIVTNPKICHGKPTFRGTRIMVSQVLEQASSGMAWEAIIDEWRGSIRKEAIAEAETTHNFIALFVLWHNMRVFKEGKRKGESPFNILGIDLGGRDWRTLLGYPPL